MRVAQQIMKTNLRVTQSDFYSDFETGKNREIDVVARSYDYYEPLNVISIAELEIFSMIECKSNQKPWIIFKGSSSVSLWDLEAPLRNKEAQTLINKINKNGFLLKLAEDAASGVTQAFTTGKDVPYEALMGALKAAEAKIRIEREAELEKITDTDSIIEEHSFSVCAFPVVVTDARLFNCCLKENGEIEICEVEYAAVCTRYPRRKERWKKGTVVYIFRESSVEVFLNGLNEFRGELKSKLPKLLIKSNSK